MKKAVLYTFIVIIAIALVIGIAIAVYHNINQNNSTGIFTWLDTIINNK